VAVGDAEGVGLEVGVGVGDAELVGLTLAVGVGVGVGEGVDGEVEGDADSGGDGLGESGAVGPELVLDAAEEGEGDGVATPARAGSCALADSPEIRKPPVTRPAITVRLRARDT
jgi:hypothetical protein